MRRGPEPEARGSPFPSPSPTWSSSHHLLQPQLSPAVPPTASSKTWERPKGQAEPRARFRGRRDTPQGSVGPMGTTTSLAPHCLSSQPPKPYPDIQGPQQIPPFKPQLGLRDAPEGSLCVETIYVFYVRSLSTHPKFTTEVPLRSPFYTGGAKVSERHSHLPRSQSCSVAYSQTRIRSYPPAYVLKMLPAEAELRSLRVIS